MSGPSELMGWYNFERVDLVRLIDPDNQRFTTFAGDPCQKVDKKNKGRCDIDVALNYFYRSETEPAKLIPRRDAIQDRLIAASEQRCYVFKLQLTRNVSNANFISGTATSLLAGAGAAFTEVSTVRALSAAAGVTNAIGAEYSKSYLHTLTLQIISRGIDIRRQAIRNEIEILRGSNLTYSEQFGALAEPASTTPEAGTGATPPTTTTGTATTIETTKTTATTTAAAPPTKASAGTPTPRSLSQYTLERAIADALRYHAACSVLTGLQEANSQIDKAENPSLKTIDDSLTLMQSIVRKSASLKDSLKGTTDGEGNSKKGQ